VAKLRKPPNLDKIYRHLSDAFPSPPQWDIPAITRDDVLKCIDDLKVSNSTGPDRISNKLIKTLKFEVADPLLSIINGSVEHGIFPNIWKSGYVTPIHKRGHKSCVDNYRPVVLMSCLGKVLEATIRNKFIDHLSLILPDNMYGFRAGKSTGDAVVAIMDRVKELRGQGKKVCLLSVDASSAFDLVSHDLLLGSLERIGVGPKMLAWTKGFLSECRLSVKIDEVLSSNWFPDIGAGQGRRFSPDLYNVSSLTAVFWCIASFFVAFADDGMDIIAGTTQDECEHNALAVLKERMEWFKATGLSLNLKKTEYMGIGFTPKSIMIDGFTINATSSLKFLGLTIQSDLGWDNVVDSLCNSIRYSASKIRTEGRLFDLWDRKILFGGWILGSVYANGIAYLPLLNISQSQRLQVAMNAGVRAVANLPRYGQANLSDIREKLKIPSIEQITEKVILDAAWKKESSSATKIMRCPGQKQEQEQTAK